MERNTELAEKTLQYIEDHPEEWDQNNYGKETGCGTVGCFAYHAVKLSGNYKYNRGAGWWNTDGWGWNLSHLPPEWRMTRDAAIEALGIDVDEEGGGRVLFDGMNTKEMLRLMVKDFVNKDKVRSYVEYLKEAHAG